jgi:Domain of unknown function (DUF4286)
MFIYNVTIKVHVSIHVAWLQWLKKVHVPEVLATDCFTKATIVRLLEIDDSEGPTYAVQYLAESKASYNLYMQACSGKNHLINGVINSSPSVL